MDIRLLQGKWNDTDSRLVAEEMVRDALKAGWYAKYEGKAAPTVVVGEDGTVELAQYNVKATGHVAKLRRDLGLSA